MLPKIHEIIHPLLKLISKGTQTRKTAPSKLLDKFELSDAEQEKKMADGRGAFEYNVSWAFSYLTKAEYIELTEQKKVYRITNLGEEALSDAEEKGIKIDAKYLREHAPNYVKNWQVVKKKDDTENDGDTENNDDIENDNDEGDSYRNLESELELAGKNFDSDLLDEIKALSWQEFEDLCVNLLEKMGYGVAATRKIRSGDGGIDGEVFEDELGLKGKIYIQAKKWDNNPVGPKDMKEFLFNVRGSKGVFITTSDFSSKAREEAKNYKDGKVALINYSDLIKLCKKYEILCEKQKVYIYKVKD